MGSSSSVVSWWEQEQLRTLVLGSLAVQYFLFFFAGRRKSRIPSCCRFFIWISYLASDALAIYALATLFNRQKKMQYHSRDLQVLWAPILLIHLGGQLVITAYNIEDNELWKRHIITSLSQVTVAMYVFCKSWPTSADKKLLAAAICLFTLGAAKCFQKPLALMRASFSSLDRFLDQWAVGITDKTNNLEDYVRRAKTFMLQKGSESNDGMQYIYSTLLLDYACSCRSRLIALKRFRHLDDEKAHDSLTYDLSNFFDLLYTRDYQTKAMTAWNSSCMWLFSVASPIVTIVLFHKSHKQVYNPSDVITTFVLLYGTLVLEFSSLFGLIALDGKWSGTVAQHNLIEFFAQTKKHSKLVCFARSLSCEVFIRQIFAIESCHSSKHITKIVRQHIQDGWKTYITDTQSYKEFNDIRGQWTLQHMRCDQQLVCSLEQPFDQSVLIWHLATDFCFYCRGQSRDNFECAQRCREISNYMMHLLFSNPEMLLPGSRKHLCNVAYDELLEICKGEETLLLNERELAQKVVSTNISIEIYFVKKAVEVYTRLIDIDMNKMWKVIQGVWVEMLCFSAGRCRGYLHAKSIGSGGEFLSYIWLLLHNTGMETFQHKLERMQNVRLPMENKRNEKKDHLEGHRGKTHALATYQGPIIPNRASTSQGTNVLHNEEIVMDTEPLPHIVYVPSYPGMNPPSQGGVGNLPCPWSSQCYEGTSS